MGKTREQETSIDPVLQAKAIEALDRAQSASEIPFMPNRGLRVAAFSPDQEAAFANNNAASEAFGLQAGGAMSMPEIEEVNGIRGYSTGGMYDDTLMKSVPQPIQDYIASMSIDPATGQMGGATQAQSAAAAADDGVYHPYQPDIYAAYYNPNQDGTAYNGGDPYSGGGDSSYGAAHGGGVGLGGIAGQVGNAVSGAWGGAQDGWNS